jgi:hypothetical protein
MGNDTGIVICQPSQVPPPGNQDPCSPTASAASNQFNRNILVYASPGSGAELFLNAIAQLNGFALLRGAYFPIKGAARIFQQVGKPPAPGLHFLADYQTLLKATRRLLDSVLDITATAATPPVQAKIIYSSDNMSYVDILRQLYPEALHLHIVRDVSAAPLRMAAEARLPVWRLCKRWRHLERAFLDAPPWPNQITITHEQIEYDPADVFSAVMSLARIPVASTDTDAFLQHVCSPRNDVEAIRRPTSVLRGMLAPSPFRSIASSFAGRCAGVYCQAELAALKYRPSVGRAHSIASFAAVAGLRLTPQRPASPRRLGRTGDALEH